MTVHLGEQETQSLEGLFFGVGEPLDPIPIANKGALIYPIALGSLSHHIYSPHSLDQSRNIEVFLFVGNPKRNTPGFGCFTSRLLVAFILLGDLCAARGVTSPLGFSVAQEIEDFITKTGDVLL